MEVCNSTSSTTPMVSGIRYVHFSIGMVSSVFMLVVIRRTPSLKGFSGMVLFNEQLACLLQQICTITELIMSKNQLSLLSHLFFCCTATTKNLSLLLLLAISVNIYIAICKSSSYSSLVTRSTGITIIACCWVLSVLIGYSPLMDSDFLKLNCRAMVTVVNPEISNIWFVVLFTIESCGSLIANIWFICKIISYKRTAPRSITSRGISDTRNNARLATFILSVSTFYSITFITTIILFYFQDPLITSGYWYVFGVPGFIHNLYFNLRPCFHLPLYKPLRETTMSLFWPKRNNTVQPSSSWVVSRSTTGGNFEMAGGRNSDAVTELPVVVETM